MMFILLRQRRLGNAAVFLIGGLTRDIEPIPILLRSGDVLIMAGPACRRAYHGLSCHTANWMLRIDWTGRRSSNTREHSSSTS